MKKVMFLLAGLFVASLTQAQQTDNKPPVKKIEVTGSAEIEITPDEIYLDISLREFKNKTTKVEIGTLEAQLQKAVKEAGIPAGDLTISNVFGTNYDQWWSKKKKDPDFMARKQYRLKLSNLDKVNSILGAVDDEGIESVNISSYTHSKMEDYRKQVKTKALQAAKAKATYMLEAIGSSIDGVLEVQEINTDNYADVQPEMMAVNSFARVAATDAAPNPSAFKKIKVRAEVRAVFFIK
ncbi:SIMPL domain-containing protein [Chitinophaga rhizophila]|uniref:SIMPL domain-containing protein n=1 Tax=Chitinophaga rhizophila TaxID=2866212 RepID=A0ABS7GDL8_9BACT|nr:SIMPL domain-containing protein [Chitinophaga rhizophila]MBW8685774.1 SIMPL domain-containing protein [Chitinophaga rhizophila]